MNQEDTLNIIYDKDNIFLPYVEWLGRLIDNPHGKGLDNCFKEWAVKFRESEFPLNEKLRILCSCAPIIFRVHKELGTGYSSPLTKEIIEIVDRTSMNNYNFVNRALDIVDPMESFKRYRDLSWKKIRDDEDYELKTKGYVSRIPDVLDVQGSICFEEARQTQQRNRYEK